MIEWEERSCEGDLRALVGYDYLSVIATCTGTYYAMAWRPAQARHLASPHKDQASAKSAAVNHLNRLRAVSPSP